MNREIKFRVWCKDSSQWVHDDARFEIYDGIIKLGSGFAWEYQQFTGLRDKDGREIYEGDIVHYLFDGDSYPREAIDVKLRCVYEEKNGWFAFNSASDETADYLWYEIQKHSTVIGNIFETPNLLE